MHIAAVQIEAIPGDLPANIAKHLNCISQIQPSKADVIVFPELSLTGYEPRHAATLAMSADDQRLRAFANASKLAGASIGVGLPLLTADKPAIGQLFFHPDGTCTSYAKQYLHDDETAVFSAGSEHPLFTKGEQNISPAVCFETINGEHAQAAAALGANIYLASAAKHVDNMRTAHAHCAINAKQYGMFVIIANAIGSNDGYISAGMSAAWNGSGMRIAMLADQTEGFVLADINEQSARAITF
ncbi:MAG: carbon-nitrogen hydrolase family protein [Pseudomonadota bacterium]